MKQIALGRGLFAQIDNCDLERVSAFKWHAVRARNSLGGWYVMGGPGNSMLLHRFILDLKDGQYADHSDRDGLNNTRTNLRRCTHSENCANRRTKNTWGRGVAVNAPKGRWQATIRVGGKRINLGSFTDPVSAAQAYDAKAREVFGEFAVLNFPHGVRS